MHLYQQLVEPTVVTHSVICKLDPHSSHPNLIVVRGASLLQVYSILPAPRQYEMPHLCTKLNGATGELPPSLDRNYLFFEAEWPLDGHLTGISPLVVNNIQTLALSFRYAKVVLLEWSQETRTFKPVSIHFYEKQVTENHYRDLNFPARMLVEPQSKCLSLWYQKDMFSVLSFPDLELEDLHQDALTGSIILESKNLEPKCRNITDMQYLNGYNGPTLGVLFQQEPTWTGSLPLKKDSVSFHIVSVDIERKSSTTIFSVDNLPYDIQQIIPLHAPVNGSLLIGSNCIVYVESNGRTLIYSVNKFASMTSAATLIDNSHLGLDLANCKVAHLKKTTHAVIATAQGDLLRIDFAVDGLKVFGFSIEKTSGCPTLRNPNTISTYKDSIFIGCDSANFLFKYKITHNREESVPPQDEEFADVYPPDLGPSKLELFLDDSLVALGPITCTTVIPGDSYDYPSTLCVGFGGGNASGVACFQRGLWPRTINHEIEKFSRFWTAGSFIVGTSASQKKSFLYLYPQFEIKEHIKTEVYTLAFAQTPSGHYWHIYSTGYDIYNSAWKLQSSGKIKQARSAVISANHAIICSQETHDLTLYSLGGSKIQNMEVIGQSKRYYLFGTHIVIADKTDVLFSTVHEPLQQEKYSFLDLPADFKTPQSLDSNISLEIESEISEILIAELGDKFNRELVVAITIDDVVSIYSYEKLQKLFVAPSYADMGLYPSKIGEYSTIVAGGTSPFVLFKGHKTPIRIRPIRTRKAVSASSIESELVFINAKKQFERVGLQEDWDYVNLGWPVSATHVGETISCIAYNDTAEVLVIGTNTPHTRGTDEGDVKMTEEPEQEAAPTEPASTEADDDDDDDDKIPLCKTFKSALKVINPETLRITDSVELGDEAVMCMGSMRLEIGVNTDQFKEFLVVGTSILLDENNVSNGHFYVYSVAEIVPEADRPEVRHKVKQVCKELCAGAVTAVCPVMGKLAVAQGQHLFMKAVQEDHTIDPIAFCDLEVYVSGIKCVRNLIFVGDYYRSTNLVNYGNEPNRLDIISKDIEPNDGVIATECISSELRGDLQAVSSDREGRLKILQYDPDNVKAMGGPRLVLQSQFYIGATVNAMVMVYGNGKDLGAIGGTNYGGLVSVMPLSEDGYRALYVVSQQIMDKEQTFACLNTRGHINMNCSSGETLIIYGPCVERFWGLTRSTQLGYSRSLGRRGIDGILGSLAVEPLDYF